MSLFRSFPLAWQGDGAKACDYVINVIVCGQVLLYFWNIPAYQNREGNMGRMLPVKSTILFK